jgi:hypothetical protein
MKAIKISLLVMTLAFSASNGFPAEPSADASASQSSAWTRFWQGVGNDWRRIGRDMKDSGVKVGKGTASAFKKMPEDFKNGFIEAGHAISGGKPKPIEPRRDP